MNDIFAWIDARRDELVAELQTLLRQPSISAQHIGLDECAHLLRDLWVADGLTNTQILSVPAAPSIVYATEPATSPGAPTLLCYSHYDVQPPEPLELWVDPPFSATLRDGVIYARGATDNKSGALAFVRAAQAFREVRGGPRSTWYTSAKGKKRSAAPTWPPGPPTTPICSAAMPASDWTAGCTTLRSNRRSTSASRRSWRSSCAQPATASTSGAAAPSCCRRRRLPGGSSTAWPRSSPQTGASW